MFAGYFDVTFHNGIFFPQLQREIWNLARSTAGLESFSDAFGCIMPAHKPPTPVWHRHDHIIETWPLGMTDIITS